MTTTGLLLALSFVASLGALGFLIWAIANRQFSVGQHDAATIFEPGEVGRADDSVALHPPQDAQQRGFDAARARIDESGRAVVLLLVAGAALALLAGSVFGLISSLKLHLPDFLVASAAMTFGRVRTMHLNLVSYGWLSMAGIAAAMWMVPRIFRTPLRRPRLAFFGACLWATATVLAVVSIGMGYSEGAEWLEMPWPIGILFGIGGACMALSLVDTARHRQVHHIYVTAWYLMAGLCWFPILFFIAKFPGLHAGVQHATVNWWFAHNVLGLWLTPLGVGAAYYLIPKIIGKPVYSYAVSLLGFWGLALFYSQVGIHHLIGGPVPTWVVTLSIVHSLMMFIPVIAVAINQHGTVLANWWAFRRSVTLRFVSVGALMYTLSSFQGSLQALRSVNSVTHFTHYTVGHAHLGGYAFTTMVMFGAFYYMLPLLARREWPWPRLLGLHFWLVVGGFAIYFFAVSIGGWLQGIALLEVGRPFGDITRMLLPYMEARSIGGTLMTLGHVVFAVHIAALLLRKEAARPFAAGQPAAVAQGA